MLTLLQLTLTLLHNLLSFFVEMSGNKENVLSAGALECGKERMHPTTDLKCGNNSFPSTPLREGPFSTLHQNRECLIRAENETSVEDDAIH